MLMNKLFQMLPIIKELQKEKVSKKKKERTYQGIQLSKREFEWVTWYQKGSNNWWNAFYEYEHRKRKMGSDERAKSWFNSVLKGLKARGLFQHVPFAFIGHGGVNWVHPGFENSGFKAEVMEKDLPAYLLESKQPII